MISQQDLQEKIINKNSLDGICGCLAYAMGIEPPEFAAKQNADLTEYIDNALSKSKADRVVMYNPDAIAQWVYHKYSYVFDDVKQRCDVEIPLATVMPSVTPVCFATMYTGAQPQIHCIQKYEKPVLTVDTLFDALVRAGKKVAIITYGSCSISKIFLERNVDYFHCESSGEAGVSAVNAKAAEVILADKHDFIVIYNGNYDSVMHKQGPESLEALMELRANCHTFSVVSELIANNWKHHNTLVGFAMDHGCHEIDGSLGSHGLDMPEDINIVHLYKCYSKEN